MQENLVVGYCRVSTLEQLKKGLGLDIQVRDLTLFAQTQGLLIDRFYKDEGRSGTDPCRPRLNQLLRDCRSGRITAVLIPSLDRLSRNVRLAENLFWKFERLGVQILIADMPSYNSHNRRDVLIRQIREAIAEDNRKDIIERLLKGRQERIRKGNPPGGNVPYGYRRHAKTLSPYPPEAEVIRAIFVLREAGRSPTRIAAELNRRHLARRNGRPWTQRQVLAALHRRLLYKTGLIRYGDVTGINPHLILLQKRDSLAL